MIYSSKPTAADAKKRRRSLVIVLVVAAVVVLIGAGWLLLSGIVDAFPFGFRRSDRTLIDLWSEGRYADVVERAEATLSTRPLDGQALTFGGFGHFYVGIDQIEPESQEAHIDRSVVLLRKALHVPNAPLAAERDYVLGKAYYHKGLDYLDLSVDHMSRSLAEGYIASDSKQYLGLAYAAMGDDENSARWYEAALADAVDESERQAVMIRASDALVALHEYGAAEAYLEEVIAGSADEYIVLLARNKLSAVLVQTGDLSRALEFTLETIDRFPGSADAYYYVGVVYDQTDRIVEARSMWRQARDIDPNHVEALRSLANRGN